MKTDSPYILCGNQNEISDHLQASYTLCGSKNGLSKLLQTSYTLCEKSKRNFRPSTSLLHALRKLTLTLQCFTSFSQSGLSDLLRASYTFCGTKNRFYYKPTKRFAQVNMVSTKLYKPPTRLAEVKTDSERLLKKSKRTHRTSRSLLHALWKPKLIFQTSKSLLSGLPEVLTRGLYGLSKHLQATYTLCGSQNGLSELLHDLRKSKRLLQSPTRFAAVKTESSNSCKPPTQFAVVKTI